MFHMILSIGLYFVHNLGLFNSFDISVFVLQSVQVYPDVCLIYLISAAVILLVSLAIMILYLLPYNFFLVFFQSLCGLNMLYITLLFSNSYNICHQCPCLSHKISIFVRDKGIYLFYNFIIYYNSTSNWISSFTCKLVLFSVQI
jgi:hypothetical protein